MTRQIDLPKESESLDKGFQLAYLIVQDKISAIDILVRALDKLSVQCHREQRRFYWRYSRAHQPIRRITRQEVDAFQWLIMSESESCERTQELHGSPSVRQMVVRYIKHLVQVTTAMSSFYVCVGINRLLYAYSTSETQSVFELITQRFPGADQYRRAKKLLSDRLTERFGEFLETISLRRGELRFRTMEDQNSWQAVVQECLSTFSPWSTERLCESLSGKADEVIKTGLLAIDGAPRQPDAQETTYCHVFIDPVCRGSLLAALALSAPETRLALPRFSMKKETDGNDGNESQGLPAPRLTAEEKAAIARRVAAENTRRETARPGSVRVLIDGLERSRFNLNGSGQLQIQLAEGAKLIEIWGADEAGDLLLGTHLITCTDEEFESSEAFLPLNEGRVELTVSPIVGTAGACAVLRLVFNPRLQLTFSSFGRAWRSTRGYIVTAVAAALIAWSITGAIYANRMNLLRQRSQHPTNPREMTREEPLSSIASYVLLPDSMRIREGSGVGIPTVSLRSQPGIVRLELSVSAESMGFYRATLKDFTDNRVLLVANSIPSKHTAAGQTVTIVVPGDMLAANTYYRVELDSISANGQAHDVDRFTFQFVSSVH